MMKKILALALAAALSLSVLAGCAKDNNADASGSAQSGAAALTPEELTDRYKEAFEKSGIDAEMLEYNPAYFDAETGDAPLIMEFFGFDPAKMESFGFSISMMNVQAYGVMAVKPVAGEEENVKAALQAFVDQQKQSFEQYLEDQYEIAKQAKLETLEDGTILMVICSNQDEVFQNMANVILGK